MPQHRNVVEAVRTAGVSLITCTSVLHADRSPLGLAEDHRQTDALLDGDVAVSFLGTVMGDPAVTRRLSTDHFSVDGALIDAWASMKSFRRKHGAEP